MHDVWYHPWIGLLLRLVLSVCMLIWLFTQVDFMRGLSMLGLVNVRLLGLVFLFYFVVRLILAYQMSLVLRPWRLPFTVPQLFKINLIATFYSLVLPGNVVAGGVASWYKLARPSGQSMVAFTMLIYFRLVNTLALLGVGLIGMWFDPHLTPARLRIIVGAMFAGIVLLSLPFFSSAAMGFIERFGASLLRGVPLPGWIQAKSRTIRQAFRASLKVKKRTVVTVLGLSLLSHLFGMLNLYLLALAMNVHLSFFVIGWVRLVLGIMQLIPISIAGLGVREVSLVFLLRDYGIPESQALSLSLAVFGMTVIGGLVGGMLEGREVWRASRQRACGTFLRREIDPATPVVSLPIPLSKKTHKARYGVLS